MTRRRRRLRIILAFGVGVDSATALALVAFRSYHMFDVAPSELVAQAPRSPADAPWRPMVIERLAEAKSGSDASSSSSGAWN
jgi:predicted ATPase